MQAILYILNKFVSISNSLYQFDNGYFIYWILLDILIWYLQLKANADLACYENTKFY